MGYKTLLLHIDASPASQAAGELAFKLAKAHQAHLTGVVLAVEPGLPTYGYHPVLVDALEVQREAVLAEGERLAGEFSREMERRGLTADCRVEAAMAPDAGAVLSNHGRYADLIVMTQQDPDSPEAFGSHLPEHVVLAAGRPVLIVPYIGLRDSVGKKILIAWDAGREAGRAVRDALPLLQRAETVEVLAVEPRRGSGAHGDQPGADIALYLARHGCKVEIRAIEKSSIPPEDVILSALTDSAADLLVMGAYGHSRLWEMVLGGVTRHIAQHMTVPVLMSH